MCERERDDLLTSLKLDCGGRSPVEPLRMLLRTLSLVSPLSGFGIGCFVWKNNIIKVRTCVREREREEQRGYSLLCRDRLLSCN